MAFLRISQCNSCLDFKPRKVWPKALPAVAWQGLLLTSFDRPDGEAVDLWSLNGCTFAEAIKSCYEELGLAELARLNEALHAAPETNQALTEGFFAQYQLRSSERLNDTLRALVRTPLAFQALIDEKRWGARDLAPLLAVTRVEDFNELLSAFVALNLSKSPGVQVFEWMIDLALMGRSPRELAPQQGEDGSKYSKRLQAWRQPQTTASDEEWQTVVRTWPWPAQVQGHWQRFGDDAGLEIKLRAHSPEDLDKKLSRLKSIRDSWSCNG